MLIYKCAVTGDELLSDTYKIELIDNIFYKVQGKRRPKADADIPDSLIGGNPSEDPDAQNEATGGADSTVEMETDVVADYRLVETGYNKKQYQAHLKEYVGKVVEHLKENNPDRVDSFKAECKTAVGKIMPKIKELQFFTGESMNPDGMVVLSEWEGANPCFYFFKDGLVEEKC